VSKDTLSAKIKDLKAKAKEIKKMPLKAGGAEELGELFDLTIKVLETQALQNKGKISEGELKKRLKKIGERLDAIKRKHKGTK